MVHPRSSGPTLSTPTPDGENESTILSYPPRHLEVPVDVLQQPRQRARADEFLLRKGGHPSLPNSGRRSQNWTFSSSTRRNASSSPNTKGTASRYHLPCGPRMTCRSMNNRTLTSSRRTHKLASRRHRSLPTAKSLQNLRPVLFKAKGLSTPMPIGTHLRPPMRTPTTKPLYSYRRANSHLSLFLAERFPPVVNVYGSCLVRHLELAKGCVSAR